MRSGGKAAIQVVADNKLLDIHCYRHPHPKQPFPVLRNPDKVPFARPAITDPLVRLRTDAKPNRLLRMPFLGARFERIDSGQ
jgi:hypothetical protein